MSVERDRRHLDIERLATIAKELVLAHGSHTPTPIVEGESGGIICQLDGMPDDPDVRHRALYEAGVSVAQRSDLGPLMHVSIVAEAWMSLPGSGRPPFARPLRDPHRKEVLVIYAQHLPQRVSSALIFEMLRDRQGKLIDLLQLRLETGGAAGDSPRTTTGSPLVGPFVRGYDSAGKGNA